MPTSNRPIESYSRTREKFSCSPPNISVETLWGRKFFFSKWCTLVYFIFLSNCRAPQMLHGPGKLTPLPDPLHGPDIK